MNSSTTRIILGRRPVLEALTSGTPVEKIVLRQGARGAIIGNITAAAKSANIRLDRLPPETYDRKYNPQASGGVAAITAEVGTVEIDELLAKAESRLESPFLIMLDGIEDPQNLGAIARSGLAAGCHGLIIPQRRTAPLSPAAMRASAGALMRFPVARVTNISEAVASLRREKVWVFGADMKGEDYREVDYPPSLAIIVGAEGRGLSRTVKSACDKLISIPLKGEIDSLNASVCAGILLFHIASIRE